MCVICLFDSTKGLRPPLSLIIRWTSHDDLTEKSAETFFHFTEIALTHKTHVITKDQNCTLRFYEKTDSIEFHPSSN